jgi:hypothetical protein
MGVSLSAEQYNDISKALDTIISTANGLVTINLTKQERQGIQSVAETRLPYLQKAFNSLIPDNPGLAPPFSGLTEANADYAYLEQLMKLKTKLMTTVEILSDHELAAGYRSFEYMRDFYHMAQRAIERNVPGADTVVDELSPLFDQANVVAPSAPATA